MGLWSGLLTWAQGTLSGVWRHSGFPQVGGGGGGAIGICWGPGTLLDNPARHRTAPAAENGPPVGSAKCEKPWSRSGDPSFSLYQFCKFSDVTL